ncbi:MAG: hypothetical protein M3R24_05880 [Chloroflexota bacterium]|nr:hypothetical protein [Chloroflexota bacterium]PLS82128.1 MAG: hypothetical protein CYG59_04955 [Chloroflexota bacterium]
MAEMRHSTPSVTLEVGYATAFGDLNDWCNQPQWALNVVKDIRQEGAQILMTTPLGEVPIESCSSRDLGAIDIVLLGNSVLPARLTSMGDGSLVYTFTFSMPTDIPEDVFRNGQGGMEEELQHLGRILESYAGVLACSAASFVSQRTGPGPVLCFGVCRGPGSHGTPS